MSIKFVAGLLIGAAAGAAIIHFLNTEEGKAFTQKLKKDAADVEDELASMADDLIHKGKSFMNDMEGKVDEATS
jgi:gas vesicle protein